MTLLCLDCGSARAGTFNYNTGTWTCGQCLTTRHYPNTGIDEREPT